MPVLCTPVWQTPPDFRVMRSYVTWYVHGWTPAIPVTTGRTTVLQETVFGGFRTFITFTDDFWNWKSARFQFSEIFEDYYVTFPGDPTPRDAGTVVFRVGFAAPYPRLSVVIDPGGSPFTQYWAFSLPPAPASYWLNSDVPTPATPFPYTA